MRILTSNQKLSVVKVTFEKIPHVSCWFQKVWFWISRRGRVARDSPVPYGVSVSLRGGSYHGLNPYSAGTGASPAASSSDSRNRLHARAAASDASPGIRRATSSYYRRGIC